MQREIDESGRTISVPVWREGKKDIPMITRAWGLLIDCQLRGSARASSIARSGRLVTDTALYGSTAFFRSGFGIPLN